MGDRVAVLKDGLLQQCDTPRRMYDHPNNVFVAGFIGSPAMNLLEVPVTDGGVKFGTQHLPGRARGPGQRRQHRRPSASGPRTSSHRHRRHGPARHGRRRRGARRRRLHLRLHRRGRRRPRRSSPASTAAAPGEGQRDLPRSPTRPRAPVQHRDRPAHRRLSSPLATRRWRCPIGAPPPPAVRSAARRTARRRVAASTDGRPVGACHDGRRGARDHRRPARPRPARPAVVDPAGGLAGGPTSPPSPAASRGTSCASSSSSGRVLAVKEIKDDLARPRVRHAAHPAAAGPALRRAVRRHQRPHHRRTASRSTPA